MNSRIEDRNEYIKNNGYRGKYENPAYHNGSFAGILVFMNMFHAVTGPIAVNTWGIPLDSGRVMIVDPGGDVDRIIAYLGELNSQLAVIMCTHGHLDHLLAVPELARRFPEAEILIHSLDAAYLGPGARERHRSFFHALGAFNLVEPYLEEMPPATALLAEGDRIADTPWTVLHTPGHSPGSICLYNAETGVLVSGDTLFKSGFGRTDAPGGNWEHLEKSLARLRGLPGETLVLPGHGEITTIGNES
jgi:glyoxylase-like metal-dependent hydrolase (beta-lactamase superfamily II)